MSQADYNRRGTELTRYALTFLSDQLTSGPQPFSLIREQAAEQGISLSVLLEAKRSLKVKSRIVGRRAVWSLPKTA